MPLYLNIPKYCTHTFCKRPTVPLGKDKLHFSDFFSVSPFQSSKTVEFTLQNESFVRIFTQLHGSPGDYSQSDASINLLLYDNGLKTFMACESQPKTCSLAGTLAAAKYELVIGYTGPSPAIYFEFALAPISYVTAVIKGQSCASLPKSTSQFGTLHRHLQISFFCLDFDFPSLLKTFQRCSPSYCQAACRL